LVDEIKDFSDVYYKDYADIKIISPNLTSIFDTEYIMGNYEKAFMNRILYE